MIVEGKALSSELTIVQNKVAEIIAQLNMVKKFVPQGTEVFYFDHMDRTLQSMLDYTENVVNRNDK